MKGLILKETGTKLHIHFNSRIIELWSEYFSEAQLEELANWLIEYHKYSNELFTFRSSYIRGDNGNSAGPNVLPYASFNEYPDESIHKVFIKHLPAYNFIRKGGIYCPSITGRMDDSFLKFSGESYLSYTREFFSPIFYWLDWQIEKIQPTQFRVEFWLTYFNSTTSARFFDIMNQLEAYHKTSGAPINVYWYYEYDDIEMKESGEEYKEDLPHFNFQLIPIEGDLQKHPMNK